MNLTPISSDKLNGRDVVSNSRRLPAWFKQDIPDNSIFELSAVLSGSKVNTVCHSAQCPNLTRCFKKRELTFMILGNVCTRNCRFCAVVKSKGEFLGIDAGEAARISRIVKELGIEYAVITSVTRDDLPDGGARHFVEVINAIRAMGKNIKIELLIPDFLAEFESIKKVTVARPCVLAHNLETVKRLCLELRPKSDYDRSLKVLKSIKDIDSVILTKSSLMLGLGEEEFEVIGAMEDLRNSGCDILILGQYLSPSSGHYPVKEFISIEQFNHYADIASGLGFKSVLSEPLARSSFKAEVLYREAHSCMI